MNLPPSLKAEFGDHPLIKDFARFLKKQDGAVFNATNENRLLHCLWKAFLAGEAAAKAQPIDTSELHQKLREQDQIAVIWSVDDVIDTCKDRFGIRLSEEHAREVLFTAERKHDANEGINWLVLQTYAQMSDFFDEYEKKEDEDDDE